MSIFHRKHHKYHKRKHPRKRRRMKVDEDVMVALKLCAKGAVTLGTLVMIDRANRIDRAIVYSQLQKIYSNNV